MLPSPGQKTTLRLDQEEYEAGQARAGPKEPILANQNRLDKKLVMLG